MGWGEELEVRECVGEWEGRGWDAKWEYKKGGQAKYSIL